MFFFPHSGNLIADSLASMNRATTMMVRFFRQRTRAGSPTQGESKSSWYSDPPRFHLYDREVINVLLNIGRAHLSTTCPIFSKFEATDRCSKQLCLAMAAVGGLFSTVDGSTTIAKSLYNDARRLELEVALRPPHQPSFQSSLNSAKTFLLLDIYGLCSGDKRSYEFIEALHYQTLEAARSCWRTKPRNLDPADREQLMLLEDALSLLDSYRVLLLSRPPCFLSLSDDHVLKENAPNEALLIPDETDLKSLMIPVEPIPADASTRSLCIISAYAWMAGPHGQESSRTSQLWRPEFVELALERWIHSARSPSSKQQDQGFSAALPPPAAVAAAALLSQKLLYHLVYLSLYSNLALLKRCAHEFNSSSAAAAAVEYRGQEDGTSLQELRDWLRGPHFPIALWHAEAMLDLVRDAIAQVEDHSQHQGGGGCARFLEPLHASYCIYFATLMVWYGTTVQEQPQLSRHLAITTATELLARLRAPVSRVLSTALRELFRRET